MLKYCGITPPQKILGGNYGLQDLGVAGELDFGVTGGLVVAADGGLDWGTAGELEWAAASGLDVGAAGELDLAAAGRLEIGQPGGLDSAADSRLDWGTADGLKASWFWIRAGHSQTLEDPFPPAQSCGVLKVHGVIVIGPDPEQRVEHCFNEHCTHGEPAELLRILHKREKRRKPLGQKILWRFPCYGKRIVFCQQVNEETRKHK